MEKAEKEAQEARQAVKTQQQAVDQAQNELNLVQASQEEKQKNYSRARSLNKKANILKTDKNGKNSENQNNEIKIIIESLFGVEYYR